MNMHQCQNRHFTRMCLPPKMNKIFLLSFGLLFVGNIGKIAADDNVLFCGESWVDAYQNCHKPCHSGDDSECGEEGWSCYGYTGCWTKWVSQNTANSTKEVESLDQNGDAESTGGVHYCGVQWIDAANSCSKPCPGGPTDCDSGEDCFVASNCARPIRRLESEMIMSLLGAQGIMSGDESGVMEESIFNFLDAKLKENQIGVKDAGVTGQKAIGGEKLRDRWLKETYGKDGEVRYFSILYHTEDDDYSKGSNVGLQLTFNYTANQVFLGNHYPDEQNIQKPLMRKDGRRYLPATSSALDVSMVITGEYRPPPYLDMDLIIANSINYASETVLEELRERGKLAGSSYFERVEDMRATSAKDATPRPTPGPTQTPTITPSSGPTRFPSSSPTRAFEQSIQTGHGASLYDGTARSFGIIFEIKTTSESPTIAIQGFDIYSSSTSNILYEVWTKEGTWQGFEGKIDEFTKVGEGETESAGEYSEESLNVTNGECTFTPIAFNKLEEVPIFGGGATRSFYITLQSREILYSRGISPEGSTDMAVMSANIDIEVLEGAGVLMYPFDQATDSMFHYRKPRGFLGVVHYHRSPCADGGLGKDGTYIWPCETRVPAISSNTETPTILPTGTPSTEPSGPPSRQRSESEGGIEDMSDDVLPSSEFDDDDDDDNFDRDEAVDNEIILDSDNGTTVRKYSDYKQQDLIATNLVLKLSGVPDRIMNVRETLKYQEILLKFLRSQEALSNVLMDVVSVRVWHQSLPKVESEEKETSVKNGGKIKIPNTSSKPKYKFNSKGRKMTEHIFDPADSAIAISSSPLEDDSEEVDFVEVTTIIQSSNSTLPPSTASKLILYVVESFNSTLIDTLHYHKVLFSYFEEIDDVSGELVNHLTSPPTLSPISPAFSLIDDGNSDVVNDRGTSFTFNVYVATGLGIAILWCILTLVTLRYLASERSRMANEKMLFSTKTFVRDRTQSISSSTSSFCDLETGMTDDEILAFKLLIHGPSANSPWDNFPSGKFEDIHINKELGLDRCYRPIRATSSSARRKSGNVISDDKRIGATSKTAIKRKSTGDMRRSSNGTRGCEKIYSKDGHISGSNDKNQDTLGSFLDDSFSDSIAGRNLNSAFGFGKSLCETNFHRQSDSIDFDAKSTKQSKTAIKRKSTGDLRRFRDITRSRERWHSEDRHFSGSNDNSRDSLGSLLDDSFSDSISGRDDFPDLGQSKTLCETNVHSQSCDMASDAEYIKQRSLLSSLRQSAQREPNFVDTIQNDNRKESLHRSPPEVTSRISMHGTRSGRELKARSKVSDSIAGENIIQLKDMRKSSKDEKHFHDQLDIKNQGTLKESMQRNPFGKVHRGVIQKSGNAKTLRADSRASDSMARENTTALTDLRKSSNEEMCVHDRLDRKVSMGHKTREAIKLGKPMQRNPHGEMRRIVMQRMRSAKALNATSRVSDSRAGKNMTALTDMRKSLHDNDNLHERLDGIVPVGRGKRKVIKRSWGASNKSMQHKSPGEKHRNLKEGLRKVRVSKAHSGVSGVKTGDNTALLTDLRKSLEGRDHIFE